MFSLTFKVSILFKSSFYFHYRKGRIIAYNTADRIVVDSRISRMVFRNYTRFDEVFFLLDGGESQRQTRGKQNLERRKLLSLRRNLNGSIRCRRKDRLTTKHIHRQEIRLRRPQKICAIVHMVLVNFKTKGRLCTFMWSSQKS